ncbi:MAG TPA: exodeoxyribonuclease VII large subunit, partial [Arenimonas sp.]|nr:exodeoxyribonuclease VII large subunit [Arenimonas sp.]
AAAELLVPEQQALRARLHHAQAALTRHWQRQQSTRTQRCDLAVLRLQNLHPQQRLQRGRERLQRLQLALLASQSQALHRLQTRLHAVRERLQQQHPSERLHAARLRLSLLGQRQQQGLQQLLPARRQQLSALARALATISPLATLGRGYALLQQDDGRVVRSATQVNAGERLQARLAEGQLRLRVEDSAGNR